MLRVRRSAVVIGVTLVLAAIGAETAPAAITPTIPIFKPPTNWTSIKTKFTTNQRSTFNISNIKFLPTRDPKVAIKAPTVKSIGQLVRTVDLTANAEPVGNQMSINSCASWAIGYGLTGWFVNKEGRFTRDDWFNPMSIYGTLSKYKNVGTWPSDNFNRIKTVGITRESDYSVDDWTYAHHSTSIEVLRGSAYKFKSWSNLFNTGASGAGDSGVSMIKDILKNQGVPVAISARVYTGFDGTGVYSKAAGATLRGNHEMLALGYNDDGLLVQNSWGTGWGNNGFIRLSWDFVKSDVYQADYATGLL